MTSAILVAAPLSLLAGVALELLLSRVLSSRAKGLLALGCCIPALAAVVALFPAVQHGGAVEANLLPWDGPLAVVFHVDALSLLFAFMGTGIGALVLLYSIGYMAEDRSATRFYALMLVFIAGLVGLVYSANLFLFYLCWEMVGLCSFGLVGFWYQNPEAVSGARKVLLMTHIAGYGLLAAILTVYARTGATLWTDPAMSQAFTTGVFILMFVALVAKSVQFPLHTWIPEAMAAPTPVSALLHSACYVKAGVYLAARMHSFGPWQTGWSEMMVWTGTVTMLVGVMYAMLQHDMKRMLAFHTVSQIGYMITGIGIGTPLAITAGLLHCLTHGFFKGGLFLAAGSVQHAAGTRDMDELGGLAPRMPFTAAVWLISSGCIMGVPLMSGFASKWMLYSAAVQAGFAVPALIAWIASVGTVFSFAKATSEVFLGPPNETTREAHESPASMRWGLVLMAAGSLVLGVAPQLAVNYILNPTLNALGMGAGIEVSWFGLAGAFGSWWISGGLILAVVSLAAGALVYLLSAPPATVAAGGAALAGAGGGVFTGGEPFSGTGTMPAADFSALLKQQWSGLLHWLDVDRYYLGLWQALSAGSAGLLRAVKWFEKGAVAWTLIFAAGLIAGIRALAPTGIVESGTAAASIPLVLTLAVTIALFALVLTALGTTPSGLTPLLMLLSGGSAVAGLMVAQPLARIALLETSTLLALVLVWRSASASRATWTYLAVALASGAALVTAESQLSSDAPAAWTGTALACGFIVKLGAFPFFIWLLSLATDLPALVLGTIVAVLDIAAFGEFYVAAQQFQGLLEPQPLWLALAAVTAVVGAVLMLAEKDLKRLLVLSSVEDLGFLLLSITSATRLGVEGAALGACVHASAKALLFLVVSVPESRGDLKPGSTGLAATYPISATGFLFGMLAMVGVPPTLGFASRWKLYAAAQQIGTGYLAVLIIASLLSLVAYVLALTRVWWGPPSQAASGKEPVTARIAIVGLVILLLAAGLWPQGLEALTGGLR